MRVFFVRHGKIPSAAEMRLSENDEGLSDEGKEEAKRAAASLLGQLAGEPLVKIVVSPRRRTQETASIIAKELGVHASQIVTDERLIERDCTPYLGQRIADVFSKNEEELVAGGMEPLTRLYTRTRSVYDDIIRTANGPILLVGHSGNLAPLVHAARNANLGDEIVVPSLALDEALRLA